jgi:uncharacterized protein YbjT (DUF2867 family)
MTKVLVLGANGQLARNTIPFLLQTPMTLTLYLRRSWERSFSSKMRAIARSCRLCLADLSPREEFQLSCR